MRIKRSLLQARLDICSNFRGQRRSLQILTESNVTQPPVPPSSFGSIRSRLSEWQLQYDKYVAGVATEQRQRETTLEKLFPIVVGSARNAQPEDIEDELPSSDFVEYDSSNYDELGEMADWMEKSIIQTGYLVEISPGMSRNEPELAVCVGKQVTTLQLLTIRGKWMLKNQNTVRWTLPNWINPKELEPLQSHVPKPAQSMINQVDAKVVDVVTPGHLTSPIVNKLNHFQNQALSIYRQHASRLDRAHDILASSTDLRLMSLEDIANHLIGTRSEDENHAALWAVRRALLRNPNKIKPASKLTERNAQIFNVRSKEQVKIIETVQMWLRDYRDAVSLTPGADAALKHRLEQSDGFKLVGHFIKHSRELILESRKIRDLTEIGFSPYKIETQDLERRPRENAKFQRHESLIIKFLELWLLTDSFSREPSLLSLSPFLLSQIGLYKDRQLNSATGLCFLIEIGVLPPWINKLLFNADLMLPCSQTNKSLEIKYQKVHVLNAEEEDKAKDRLKDSLLEYRHDWGNLRVFCIDPSSAKEIDDGISIEEADAPNEFWVRIHIANPSAFLPESNEDASSLAASLHQTFYSPESKWPMLPEYLSKHCSVRPGGPALTISAKLDLDGNMLAVDIRSGVVHNVSRLDYRTADETLGREVNKRLSWLVGAEPVVIEATQVDNALSPDDAQKLSQLLALSKKLSDQRLSRGSINSGSRNQSVDVSVCSKLEYQNQLQSPGLPFMYPNREEGFTFLGEPVIEVHTAPMFDQELLDQDQTFGAAEMVGEFMILAGSIAATWAKERNLPFIYRGALALTTTDEILQFQKKHSLYKRRPENLLGFQYHRQTIAHFGPAFGTAKPFQHDMLGLGQYSKVTSPLRRYSDLVNHWQIGAALAYEHETGQKLSLETQPQALVQFARQNGHPFQSEEDVQRLLPRFEEREKQLVHSTYYSNTFWLTQFLYRAVYHKECVLPEIFRVAAIQAKIEGSNRAIAGRLLDYGIPVFLDRNSPVVKEAGGIKYCDEWEAVVKLVDLDKFMLLLEPTRLISRLGQDVLDAFYHKVEHLNSMIPQLKYTQAQ